MLFPHNPSFTTIVREQANAELLQWHVRERKKDVMLCHPADGIQ
jgi:hypothetical protein